MYVSPSLKLSTPGSYYFNFQHLLPAEENCKDCDSFIIYVAIFSVWG